MARNRQVQPEDRLPEQVYRGRTCFEWHPRGGGSITLCPLDSTLDQLYRSYFMVVDAYEADGNDAGVRLAPQPARRHRGSKQTVREVKENYFRSPSFTSLAPKTQKGYHESWRALDMTFGKMGIDMVSSKYVRQFMDKRGMTAKVSANRERALLSNIMVYAREHELIAANPCQGVRKFKETGRAEVYIEDEEYYAFLRESTPIIQIFMELSYLMAARGQDIRMIQFKDLHENGIFIRQQKTGKKQLTRWNDRLRQAVELAKSIHTERALKAKKQSSYLLITKDGLPYKASTLISQWARNKRRILKNRQLRSPHGQVPTITWTFHDIKAKSISDYQGDKQLFSGHKSRIMMERYNRTGDVVDALDKPAEGLEKPEDSLGPLRFLGNF